MEERAVIKPAQEGPGANNQALGGTKDGWATDLKA